jgi:transposase
MENKYTDKQRLDAVKAYERGSQSIEAAAMSQGVSPWALTKWIASYRAHGSSGIANRAPRRYSAEFKLEVLRRIEKEGLSFRQASALFDVRRVTHISEWTRTYAKYGAAALEPYWSAVGTRISKTLRQQADAAMPNDDKLTREQLLRALQLARMENAYLKKVDALVRAKTRSVPDKGR